MAILNGTDYFLYIDGVKVGNELSHSFNRTYNYLDKKGIINDREIFMTDRQGTVNLSLYVDLNLGNYDTIISTAENQIESTFEIKRENPGFAEFSFNGFITELNQPATDNDAVRVELEIVITGAVTYTPTVAFISTWNTANTSTGSSASNQIQLPLISTGVYDFVVNYGDGTIETITSWNQAETLHSYSRSGIYEITIVGTIQGWSFAGTGDRNKISEINNWGSLAITGGNAFFGCENLSLSSVTGVPTLSSSSSLNSAFRGCTNLTTINNLENWDITSCTDLTSCFNSCPSFNSTGLNSWDLSNATNLSSFLFNCSSFNQPLNNWNVSNVTNFGGVFGGCSVFDQDLSAWNISAATRLDSIFSNCVVFDNGGNAMTWTTGGSCTNYNSMFLNALLFNQDCSSWNVSGATSMVSMFNGAQSFNNASVNLFWTMGTSLVNVNNMFSNAKAFNVRIDSVGVGSWSVAMSTVTAFNSMFENVGAVNVFNQDLSNWDTSSGQNFSSMFSGCGVFDQDLAAWDLTSATNMANMLDNTALSTANYDSTLIGWELPTAGTTPTGITLGANGLTYTSAGAGGTARTNLINNDSWSFVGDSGV